MMADLNKLLIKRIKNLRKRLGISQEKLSVAASLDPRYVNKIEDLLTECIGISELIKK